MLSANIFYSGYNIWLSILSLIIGFSSIFLVQDSKKFNGLLLFQLGSLMLVMITYLTTHEHILYRFDLNYNFVIFIKVFLSLLTSILWINSASELYNNTPANRETLTFYISLGLTGCIYYSFIDYNIAQSNLIGAVFTVGGIFLLLFSSILTFYHNRTVGNFLLILSLLLLGGKLVISSFFFRYGWLNLNIFNWIWIYVFIAAVMFIKFSEYEEKLQKSWNIADKLNLQMNNIIDSSPLPIMIFRITDEHLLMLNQKAGNMFGLSKKETSFHKLTDFFIDEDNRKQFFRLMEKEHEVENFDIMVCNLITAYPFWLSLSAKTIEYNNEMAIYMAFQDITMRKERESNLQNQADRDPLTLAWNRRYFEKIVPEYIADCIKQSRNFSLLMLDADKFKNINDSHGHKIGDKILIELAEICRRSLREDDVVARFGGEEFIIFLNNTDANAATSVAERLRTNIADASVQNDSGEDVHFTVSIGVVSSEQTSSLEVLLRQVDDAMYLAKNRGRNCVALYNEEEVKANNRHKRQHKTNRIHPIFQNEENEEFSLLDSYENKIL
ncbi:MAG: GGDEF domain-containing protein [Alphaproteobacteria bacterium]|nr:GGDEF domain-containing protein [Alphaproteobacteria bacterium]